MKHSEKLLALTKSNVSLNKDLTKVLHIPNTNANHDEELTFMSNITYNIDVI